MVHFVAMGYQVCGGQLVARPTMDAEKLTEDSWK